MPCVMALRVVSLPATASIDHEVAELVVASAWPSISALTSLVTMSSAGHLRRSSAMVHA